MIVTDFHQVKVTIAEAVYAYDQGATLLSILESFPPAAVPVLAARVNGELQELTYPIYTDSQVAWLDLSSEIGMRIYKRSIDLVLLVAVTNLFPSHRLRIEHSLVNGTYCELRGVTMPRRKRFGPAGKRNERNRRRRSADHPAGSDQG